MSSEEGVTTPNSPTASNERNKENVPDQGGNKDTAAGRGKYKHDNA